MVKLLSLYLYHKINKERKHLLIAIQGRMSDIVELFCSYKFEIN
jgi:hypothetical protein